MTMRAGDLVAYLDERWIAVRVDDELRVALLVNQAGRRVEVADSMETDEPEVLQVVAHPPTAWPFVALPTRRLTGPVVTVTIPNPRTRDRDLNTWVDWVPSDPLREGGTMYFNPSLRLRQGEVLLATFRNGTTGRITIPRSFGTVAQRGAAKSAPPKYVAPEERTRFNRDVVMRDNGEDD